MEFKLLSGIANAISRPITAWQENKREEIRVDGEVRKLEVGARIAVATHKLKLAESGQQITASWDARAQEDARKSWKDELLLILFAIPAIMSFFPSTQVIALEGFRILSKTPMWYRVSLLGIVAAVFGLRWLVAPIVNRMSNKATKTELPQ